MTLRASIASIDTPSAVLVELHAVGAKRKRLAQLVDELVDLGQAVTVVQAALELIAEQIGEALPAADTFEHAQAPCARAPRSG